MDPRLQKRIQRYGWDKAAPSYEDGWKDSLADAQHELLRMADAQTGEHALDIACGTGLVSLPLAEAVGPNGYVVATDISEAMIESIQALAHMRRLSQLDAFRADAESIGQVADASMDLVTCALGLMYVPDTDQAMAETLRTLKPGGRAVFAVWVSAQNAAGPIFFRLWMRGLNPRSAPSSFGLGLAKHWLVRWRASDLLMWRPVASPPN